MQIVYQKWNQIAFSVFFPLQLLLINTNSPLCTESPIIFPFSGLLWIYFCQNPQLEIPLDKHGVINELCMMHLTPQTPQQTKNRKKNYPYNDDCAFKTALFYDPSRNPSRNCFWRSGVLFGIFPFFLERLKPGFGW